MSITKRVVLVLTIGLLTVVPVTYAQDGANLSQQKLEQYTQAQNKVAGISQEYRERLGEVQDREKATELRNQARQEMAQAVIATGLTVPEYNRITQAAQNDPKLRERLLKHQ
ncbi:DUF4168 domain-containing protein [Nitrococcus mobilis]|uniref:DUF4168 domain-containing protein n=1 Tax=Nitrococcus mobilis Nb-231 TaxID=314278 RepID=A4BLQ5_9GAMM|nr:DUF4168 domain-containing protein [Nitrococcus mobilis]EAR23243.1 hypothetical protein NB231_15523 [Nitrococcus mobilis Nb-231]